MKNDFIEKFVCGDNLPENISQRESIIMEARASLLIEAHFGSERFPAFLSKRDPGRILHISPKEGDPRPLKFHDGVISGETSAFELTPPSVSSKEQTALYMAGSDLTIWRVANNEGDRIYYSFEMRAAIIKGLEDSLRRGVLNFFNSAFEAIRRHSECDTPTKTCLYWGQEPRPYAAIKKIWGFHWNPWSTRHNLELRNIQPILKPEMRITDVFTFNGKWGETLLRVLKIEYGSEKLLLPLTTWFRSGSNQPMFFFTPGESAIPLFNLEQLEDCGDKTVILTDSVEIAAKNQGQFANTIWTSFYGDWRYTDWTPLREARQIVLLVTNHSGRSLAETYGTAKGLADYLAETVKLENLGYIQLQTDYDAEQPGTIPESYQEMNMDGFRAMAERAEEALKPHPEFWAEPVVKRTDAPGQTKDLLHVEQQPYRYLLRPFLVEGTTSLIHAPKGVGKSALGYSIAGALTSIHKAELCPGTWWFAREEPCRVLCLDFENSESVISKRLNMFCFQYWGASDEDRDAGFSNLAIRCGDQLPPCLNYALPENHSAVLKWLDEAETQGHVDLMVIDTYSRFINSQESAKSVAGFTALCNQINQRGTTVLVIHHSGSDGDVRGFKEKRDILYSCVHLTREGGGPADDLYNAPLKVEWENLREPDYNPTQVIKLTPNGWMPDGIDDEEALEAFRRQNFAKIVEQYARLGFTNADMQKMLNVSNGKFYELKATKE